MYGVVRRNIYSRGVAGVSGGRHHCHRNNRSLITVSNFGRRTNNQCTPRYLNQIKLDYVRFHSSEDKAEKDSSSSSSSSSNHPSSSSPDDWRKSVLNNLQAKFDEPSQHIETDEELQPMWRDMESRVTRRRPRTLADTGGKTGRVNVKRTDEEFWMREGLYDDKSSTDKK